MRILTKIIGTGSYIPSVVVKNNEFLMNTFYNSSNKRIIKPNEEIIKKLFEITGIKERRYLTPLLDNSYMAYHAAIAAILDAKMNAKIDPKIDFILVAHNYGNVHHNTTNNNSVPSIASLVKKDLSINNPNCITNDIIGGCPGWLKGVIEADGKIKLGRAKTILVIGSEALSRVSDPHDVDSMIFADGAGAVLLQVKEDEELSGILSYSERDDADLADIIYNAKSYNPTYAKNESFIHMKGTKVYAYALEYVPQVVKDAIDKAGLHLDDISKILIHQANEKMNYAIGERLYKLYGKSAEDFKEAFPSVMPMTIGWLGNSSVATIPTLLDLIMKGKMPGNEIKPGDNIVFASVGAGMNINAMVYRM